MKKSILKTVGIIAIALFGMASCSSDDSNSGPGNGGGIDIAVGTFKGKITIVEGAGSGTEYFDATVVVTKASNNQLKVAPKSGEAYSSITPKTIKVYNNSNVAVFNDGNTPEGTFSYSISSKSLIISTQQQSASDITFAFQGAKQ